MQWPKRYDKRQPWTPSHIQINEHQYSFESYGQKNRRRVSYRCIHGSHKKCKAILKADFSPDLTSFHHFLKYPHTCLTQISNSNRPYFSEGEIRQKVSELYIKEQFHGMPDLIFCEILKWINTDTPPNATKNVISISAIRSYIRELNKINPKSKLTFDNCRTLDNQSFLLFSTVLNEKPIYAFASSFMIGCIPECSIIGIDGTFYTAPENFYQTFVFMGRTSVMNIPILFLVLPDKKQESYDMAFRFFLNSIHSNNIAFDANAKFICDFEIAEINSIKSILMKEGNTLQLCYFHFCKSMYKKLSAILAKQECIFTRNLFDILLLLPLIKIDSAKKFIRNILSINKF